MIGQKTSQRSFAKSVDWLLIISYLLLVVVGVMNIYSTVHYSNPDFLDLGNRAFKQLTWMGASIVAAILILFVIPTRIYEPIAPLAYSFILVLLVLVIFMSSNVKGSHSWFQLGPISLQPAELSKISTSLMLALVISKLDINFRRAKDYLVVAVILLLPMIAILAENETGSMLVYIGFLLVLYREGVSGWWLTLLGVIILVFVVSLKYDPFWAILITGIIATACNEAAVGTGRRWWIVYFPVTLVLIAYFIVYTKVCAAHPDGCLFAKFQPLYVILPVMATLMVAYLIKGFRSLNGFKMASVAAIIVCVGMSLAVPFVFEKVLKPHQQGRIQVLLGMVEDPKGAGYNVTQSKIAIGSGGFFGKGYLAGTQSTFGFVPEQSTDFIFCTIGEEGGFLGCATLILLYVLLIWRIIRGAEKSRERFTRIYGYCVASCLTMHLVINIGMTIGLMPVIGIPLPLVSYGGSSLLTFTVLIFIFVAMDRNEKKYF